MAELSHADQDRFSVPRFHSGRSDRPGPGNVHGPGAALRNAWHPGMALILFQGSHDRAWTLPRARHLHPVNEAEKYAPVDARRGPDHALRPGVLRLISPRARLGCP